MSTDSLFRIDESELYNLEKEYEQGHENNKFMLGSWEYSKVYTNDQEASSNKELERTEREERKEMKKEKRRGRRKEEKEREKKKKKKLTVITEKKSIKNIEKGEVTLKDFVDKALSNLESAQIALKVAIRFHDDEGEEAVKLISSIWPPLHLEITKEWYDYRPITNGLSELLVDNWVILSTKVSNQEMFLSGCDGGSIRMIYKAYIDGWYEPTEEEHAKLIQYLSSQRSTNKNLLVTPIELHALEATLQRLFNDTHEGNCSVEDMTEIIEWMCCNLSKQSIEKIFRYNRSTTSKWLLAIASYEYIRSMLSNTDSHSRSYDHYLQHKNIEILLSIQDIYGNTRFDGVDLVKIHFNSHRKGSLSSIIYQSDMFWSVITNDLVDYLFTMKPFSTYNDDYNFQVGCIKELVHFTETTQNKYKNKRPEIVEYIKDKSKNGKRPNTGKQCKIKTSKKQKL